MGYDWSKGLVWCSIELSWGRGIIVKSYLIHEKEKLILCIKKKIREIERDRERDRERGGGRNSNYILGLADKRGISRV